MKTEKVLTTGKVAKICNVATRTVQKWLDEGILKGYKLPNSKDRRVQVEELVKFMAKYNMPTDWLKEAQKNDKTSTK